MDKLLTKATIQKADISEFTAIASTAIEDRHGEIVSVEGWDLKAFKKNPVLLWAHDHNEPAIGTASKVWVEGTGKKAALMIKGKLHDYTDKAKAIKQMVEEGIIKTMSVGFKPIDMEDNTFTSQELLEVSFVNVPANPQAMIAAYKSLKDAGFENKTISELGIPVAVLDELGKLREDVDQLKTVVKAQKPLETTVNPLGRTKQVQKNRLAMLKVIARATDKLYESKQVPISHKASLKTIKRATEIIIVADKKDLNGSH